MDCKPAGADIDRVRVTNWPVPTVLGTERLSVGPETVVGGEDGAGAGSTDVVVEPLLPPHPTMRQAVNTNHTSLDAFCITDLTIICLLDYSSG